MKKIQELEKHETELIERILKAEEKEEEKLNLFDQILLNSRFHSQRLTPVNKKDKSFMFHSRRGSKGKSHIRIKFSGGGQTISTDPSNQYLKGEEVHEPEMAIISNS